MPARPAPASAAGTWLEVSCRVNGEAVAVLVPAERRLVTMLREDLHLTGTKVGCEVGVCGACAVLVDGRPVSSCLTLAAQVEGAAVVTVEGLATLPGLPRLQEAFLTEGASQCGFCTGGQLVSAAALLLAGRAASMDRAQLADYMQGNLCRCTGYYGILRAIEKATS